MNYKKTSLYEEHEKLSAKIVPFAGFLMPVSYKEGLVGEYKAVRNSVGMFDVSHMGKISLEGENISKLLNYVTVNNVDNLNDGDAQYNMFCNHEGNVIDDIIVYRHSKNHFFLIINASNIDKDYDWLMSFNKDFNLKIKNQSNDFSIIALQGKDSRKVVKEIFSIDLKHIQFYTFETYNIFDNDVIISRTGYTGELGFELIANHKVIIEIWKKLVEKNVQPCGLASRDVLRIEMKYCLYGNDLTDSINPIQAGLKWVVYLTKKNFIGKKHLENELENVTKRLICFEMVEKSIPRKNYEVYDDEEKIGVVSSGTFSISLNKGIGMAFINSKSLNNKNINIKIRNKMYKAIVIKPPFIKNNSLHS